MAATRSRDESSRRRASGFVNTLDFPRLTGTWNTPGQSGRIISCQFEAASWYRSRQIRQKGRRALSSCRHNVSAILTPLRARSAMRTSRCCCRIPGARVGVSARLIWRACISSWDRRAAAISRRAARYPWAIWSSCRSRTPAPMQRTGDRWTKDPSLFWSLAASFALAQAPNMIGVQFLFQLSYSPPPEMP